MSEQTIATLVKYNQWYIPADSETYKILVTLGMSSTQLHEDMIGVLKLMCSKRNIVLKGRKFRKVLAEFQETIEQFWTKQKHRTAAFDNGRWVFRANKTAYAKAKKKGAGLLENKLRRFFERWGIDADFAFSENAGSSLKLVVDFKKRKGIPVIPIDVVAEEQEHALTIGNHRIKLAQDRRFLYFEIQTKCGSEWKRILFSRARHEDVSDPRLFIGSLIESYSRGD